jgi:hypothetical protein
LAFITAQALRVYVELHEKGMSIFADILESAEAEESVCDHQCEKLCRSLTN